MSRLIDFLKVLVGIAPELVPVVRQALTQWTVSDGPTGEAVVDDIMRRVASTQEAAVDERIDEAADIEREKAGLD